MNVDKDQVFEMIVELEQMMNTVCDWKLEMSANDAEYSKLNSVETHLKDAKDYLAFFFVSFSIQEKKELKKKVVDTTNNAEQTMKDLKSRLGLKKKL